MALLALLTVTDLASGAVKSAPMHEVSPMQSGFVEANDLASVPSSGGESHPTRNALTDEQGVLADRAALTAFYRSTGGSGWTSDLNWLSDESLGKWRGVFTGPDGRVEMLILRDNGLRGRIPELIAQLERLRVLDLSGNSLSG